MTGVSRKIILTVLILLPVMAFAEESVTAVQTEQAPQSDQTPQAGSADHSFREALEGRAPFSESISLWAAQLREGRGGAAAAYNMANALALDGREAEAMALYQRAMTERPGGRDYRHNRDLLLKELDQDAPSWTALQGILWFPLLLAGRTGIWCLTALIAIAALILMGLSLFRRRLPSLPAVISLAALLLYGGVILGSWELYTGSLAVVRPDELILYEGDSVLYPPSGTLSKAVELRILEHRDGWIRVKAEGTEGWCEERYVFQAEELIQSY